MKNEWYHKILANTLSKGLFNSDFPYQVRIETINSCNSKCSFCPMSVNSEETKLRNVVKMDNDLFEKIIKELHDESFEGDLKFYTQNEPLLDRRITDFVKRAKKAVPMVKRIQIDTNGLLLTEELGVSLIEAGINHLHINDYSKDLSGGFNHRKEKIKNVAEKLIERFTNITIVHRPRLIEEVLDSRGGHAPNNRLMLQNAPQVSCIYPFFQFPITSNGNVGLCCVDAIFEQPLGNVTNNTIKSIWKNKIFTEFRLDLSLGKRKKKLCSQCTFIGHAPGINYKVPGGKSSRLLYSLMSLPISGKIKLRKIKNNVLSKQK